MLDTVSENTRQQPHYPQIAKTPRIHGKEMGCTPEEFVARLQRALGPHAIRAEPQRSRLVVADGPRHAVIEYERRSDRRLGALTLPVLQVEIRLTGYTDIQRRDFMKAFDQCFLRIGG